MRCGPWPLWRPSWWMQGTKTLPCWARTEAGWDLQEVCSGTLQGEEVDRALQELERVSLRDMDFCDHHLNSHTGVHSVVMVLHRCFVSITLCSVLAVAKIAMNWCQETGPMIQSVCHGLALMVRLKSQIQKWLYKELCCLYGLKTVAVKQLLFVWISFFEGCFLQVAMHPQHLVSLWMQSGIRNGKEVAGSHQYWTVNIYGLVRWHQIDC